MKTYHAASMHYLLSSELLQSQESVSQVCDRPCPFCQREYERPIDLQHHVAGHLEATALLSLPNLDNVEEGSEAGQVNSNSANRNYAESRVDDFDRMEPLVFSENDHSGDIPKMTSTSKELFRRKLEVESVPFDSMNEVNVEARQAYSSDLAGEWLSRLPIELGEEGELPSKSRSESLSLNFTSELIAILKYLSQVYSDVESGTFPDISLELRSARKKLQRLVEAAGSLQYLSDWQRSKIENLLEDTNKLSITYKDPKMTSGINRTSVAAKLEISSIQLNLELISFNLSDLVASYVTPAPTSYGDLTFCSFPRQVKEGAEGVGEGLEISGQSRMRSILANLIALDPSASYSEWERLVDDQMPLSPISKSFNITGLAEPHMPYISHKRSRDQQEAGSSNHWLSKVFNQSRPSTLLENPGESSVLFGENVPIHMAKPEARGYLSVADFTFEDSDLLVGLYQRSESGRSGFLCRTAHLGKLSWEHLVSLVIERSGPFLKLIYRDREVERTGTRTLWAGLKFPDYESMFMRLLYLALSSIAVTL